MILCIDIGNTNIKIGVFDKNNLVASFRISSVQSKTSDEYGIALINLLNVAEIKKEDLTGIIISSVIPSLNYTIEHMCSYYLKLKPIMIGQGTKTGLNLKVDNPREVGADRIVNSIAALKKYGGPVIVIDFGTATTFNAVTDKYELIGGVIAPGIKGSLESLVTGTAKLPRVEIETPKGVLGKNTTTNMQAGIVFGFAGLVEFIVKKMKEELGGGNIKVVATGGFSEIISKEACCIDAVDKKLTLDGLKILYELNQAEVKG
jgi:type III pantothenate kinase